ncbi:MAG: DUF3445 domain-containing protein [Pseudomonadota bacterium]
MSWKPLTQRSEPEPMGLASPRSPAVEAFASNPRTRSFEIGMQPLDPENWIEVDDRLEFYRREKSRLIVEDRDAVWRARSDSLTAQVEVRDGILAYLAEHYPAVFAIADADTDFTDEHSAAPLLWVSRFLQDDLVLMRKIDGTWRLAAGSVCFPSTWAIADKFDRSMAEIHDPVPGFAGRMARMVDRIFDNLKPGQPVIRHNVSLYPDGNLDHRTGPDRPHRGEWPRGRLIDTYLRVERQTLMCMPESGDILFTIKVMSDPISALRCDPQGEDVARRLIADMQVIRQDQREYKTIGSVWPELIAEIERSVLGG